MPKRKKALIGTTDFIDLPEFDLINAACKIDTGAQTSTLNCSDVHLHEHNGQEVLSIKLYAPKFGITTQKQYSFSEFRQRKVRSSNGLMEIRYSIKTPVVIFNKTVNTEFTLSFRDKMKFPILLGKRFLKNRFVVDVALKNLNQNFKTQA